jgi:hypothetical protein
VAVECLNVSMGGAAVQAAAGLDDGSLAHLELSIGSDERPVSIRCEVVRRSDAELGLRFLALDRPSLEAILSLL